MPVHPTRPARPTRQPSQSGRLAQGRPRRTAYFHVAAAGLRGYGDSSAPPEDPDSANYSFRAMAQGQVEVMRALGHERCAQTTIRTPPRSPQTYVDDPTPGDAFNVPSISPIVRPLVSNPINQIAAAPTKYQNAK
jgi:hypothetical protein